MPRSRLPRFHRSQTAPPMQLTRRDAEVLLNIHRHRFLRSDHLTSLLAGSRQQLLRRFQLLYHHGFVERPRCQIDYYQSGSRPMVYGIGSKGAAFVRRRFSLPYRQPKASQGDDVARLFLEHALMVSDVLVAIELACRNRPGIRFIAKEDINLPESAAGNPDPFRWSVELSIGTQFGVVPDAVFGIEVTSQEGLRNTHWFLLEADRGTMPVVRQDLKSSSIFRKLLSYEATWQQGIHRSRFDWSRFRVLAVTSNSQRLQSMIEATHHLKSGRGLFLFTDVQNLERSEDLLSLAWHTTTPDHFASLLD